ncbi:MAG: DUF2891 domain-containing protein [Oscillatoriales cyanobacterium RM1_1_9]|nr:DUF2891 domain-containing protein [Oscillatoriales cyanobacterium SM2_3_0]NJO47681.1 DUF2891 domain-containing protein [Oscillatoriales cyanobacterium RM2_1_1]NJO72154.1 DUF2891 domain-containing protein [Oscillatoriales cyanobacterium RM1_1_9]
MKPKRLDSALVSQFAQFALDCIAREYPHVHRYWLEQPEDLISPRQLTPVFYGCLDWHSAVHSHWTLVRAIRCCPDLSFARIARAAIQQNFMAEKVAVEVAHLKSHPRFECPYGLAWLLQLTAELRAWPDPQAQHWWKILQPLEMVAIENLQIWMEGLTYPDRTGTHAQTAFTLGLIWDWAMVSHHPSIREQIQHLAQRFYYKNRYYPLHLEPLGYDFLSPGLAQADLMRRLLPFDRLGDGFSQWLHGFLPQLAVQAELDSFQPIYVQDPEDYTQSHFEGLNLSRAWMLAGIVSGLSPEDSRIPILESLATWHHQVGLQSVSVNHYAGSHWLGSFMVYLITHSGLAPGKP